MESMPNIFRIIVPYLRYLLVSGDSSATFVTLSRGSLTTEPGRFDATDSNTVWLIRIDTGDTDSDKMADIGKGDCTSYQRGPGQDRCEYVND